MTRAEKLFVIIWIINLIIAVVYFLCGTFLYVPAMKLLKDQGIKARWYVLGEGELRNKLQQKIDSLGLKEDFLLLGAKENPYPYYKQCDLYVHATRFEGKSIAIQEAQVLGCTILVSDCSGNREMWTNLTGFAESVVSK